MRGTLGAALCAFGFALGLGACSSPQYGNSCPISTNATDAEKAAELAKCKASMGEISLDQAGRKDVDILFVIDNSPSMSPKQKALSEQIPKFIQRIEALNINYHVGIVTTDIGSTTSPSAQWQSNAGSCNTYAGDDGRLQAKACTDRLDLVGPAKEACNTLCPEARFVPTDGKPYISKIDGVTNVPVTGANDEGPARAFKCMALVGDVGCGLESPLEAAKRALDGHLPENKDFLRPNSVLSVIFITDEDDCSVQMARRMENNPNTRSCDPTQPDSYDCYNIDYRCMARSTQCDQSMMALGEHTNCKERADSYLEPVQKYYQFLTTVRQRPDRLVVSGIWTLPSVQSGGKLVVTGVANSTPTLARALSQNDSACAYDDKVFGQAQHRLSKFAGLFGKDGKGNPAAPELSICDINGYENALQRISEAIAIRVKPWCLGMEPRTTASGQPICVVGDVDETTPSASPDTTFPSCSKTCCNAWAAAAEPSPKDAGIQAACAAETTEACFCAVPSTVGACGGVVDSSGNTQPPIIGGVWRRGGAEPPTGKVVSFRCASAR